MGVSEKLNCLFVEFQFWLNAKVKLNIKRGVEAKITGIGLSNKLISVFFLRTFFFVEIK